MIHLTNISKSWPEFKLHNINLRVKKGEYFVVLGPTGAGKTLLLELIAGFFQPDFGQVGIFDQDITNYPPEERGIGFVYQDFMLFPHLNVFNNIGFGLKIRKYPDSEVKKKVRRTARTLGIDNLLNREVTTLSGGEAQRVALARALVIQPKVLLLDEPLSALDPNIQEKVREEIKDIHAKFGITTIHITHNREEAIILADRIAIMESGRIHQVGSPHEIFRKPTTRFVAEFVGVQNIFQGRIKINGLVEIKGLNSTNGPVLTTSTLTGKVNIALRPEDIIITSNKVQTSARNVLIGRVVGLRDIGTVVRVDVNAGRHFLVSVTKQALDELGISIGSDVYLMFKASAVHVFN
jgi:molybdate/tungstate transport system ATP-binding protein